MKIERLREDLITLGEIGRKSRKRIENLDQLDKENGLNRATGTEENRKSRDYIVGKMKERDLEVRVDKVGNIFGKLEGKEENSGTVMTGSHLDSVPNGGMFDGALGVVGALEAIRILQEEGFENKRSIEVVVLTNEEGTAFNPGLLGSSVLAGNLSAEKALSLRNEEGTTLKKVLQDIGYKGNFSRSLEDVTHFVEMHVEQGPILEKRNVPIGVVDKITGLTSLNITIEGKENHAGTTPMKFRDDALLTASKIVSFVNSKATDLDEEVNSSPVGTVGKLNVYPNAFNVIPGKVEMTVDIRDIESENMEKIKEDTLEYIEELEKESGITATADITTSVSPVPLSERVINEITDSARTVGEEFMVMSSGAAHDTQIMAKEVKAGLIFVPSVNGISHSPLEWTRWEDIEKGIQVLTETLKNLTNKER